MWVQKRHVCEEDYIWYPSTCSCENGKYLASIMDDSTTKCDEVIESYDEEINLMKIKEPVKRKISIFYLRFY